MMATWKPGLCGVALLVASYLAAYACLVTPTRALGSRGKERCSLAVPVYGDIRSPDWPLFRLAHRLDRILRPDVWWRKCGEISSEELYQEPRGVFVGEGVPWGMSAPPNVDQFYRGVRLRWVLSH